MQKMELLTIELSKQTYPMMPAPADAETFLAWIKQKCCYNFRNRKFCKRDYLELLKFI